MNKKDVRCVQFLAFIEGFTPIKNNNLIIYN